jgi:NADPH:quinone reductase-like Zn-dependent oxidoreductase
MDGADVVHDTVGGKTFTACFSLVRQYGDLVSNVEGPWEDEAIATDRAADAHRALEAGDVVGKAVLTME